MNSIPDMTHTFHGSFSNVSYEIISIEDSLHIIQMITLTLSSTYMFHSEYAVMLLNNDSEPRFVHLSHHLNNICKESGSLAANQTRVFHCTNSIPRQRQFVAILGVNFDSIQQVS